MGVPVGDRVGLRAYPSVWVDPSTAKKGLGETNKSVTIQKSSAIRAGNVMSNSSPRLACRPITQFIL